MIAGLPIDEWEHYSEPLCMKHRMEAITCSARCASCGGRCCDHLPERNPLGCAGWQELEDEDLGALLSFPPDECNEGHR